MSVRPASAHARTTALEGPPNILLAASLWGTTGTVRTFAPTEAGPVAVGAARIVLGGLLLLALAVRGRCLRPLLARGRTAWAALALGAVCVAVYQTAFFAAVARTGVAVGTVVTIGSGPVFAGLLAALLGHQRLTARWAISTAGAVAGCTALIGGGRDAGGDLGGIALALLSGLTYAGYAVIAARFITTGADRRAVMGVLFGGAALLLTPVLLAISPEWLLSVRGGIVTLYLGAVTTTLGYVLYARGLRTTPVAAATTLTLAEPAVATLLGLVVLGERLTGVAACGLVLLTASLVVLMAAGASTRRRPAVRIGSHHPTS